MISLRFPLGAVLVLVALTATVAQDADKDKPKKEPPPKTAPEPPGINDTTRPGEEYRRFFKKPTNVAEFWGAMQFEIEIGKYDLAAALMHGLLALKPTEEELMQIHEKDGMVVFLKLRFIKPWVRVPPFNENYFLALIAKLQQAMDEPAKIIEVRERMDKEKKDYDAAIEANLQALKDVEELINLVTAAVKKQVSDPVRINKWLQHLKQSPEEREYALKQLYASRGLVVPYLLTELKTALDDDRVAMLGALTRLSSDIVPPLLGALDAEDPRLLVDLIGVLSKRGAVDAVPRLWFLSASQAYPIEVRRKALAALTGLLGQPQPSQLPPAKAALVREAERYYQHQAVFADPKAVPLWRWDGSTVTLTLVPASKAEEYYAIKYASQALLLDPTYQPAQILLLSTILDKTYEQMGIAKPLLETAPQTQELLATSSPELINQVLERALTDRRPNVIVGAIRALGALGDVRSIRPTASGAAVLVRALNYPDRRVNFAAAEALLNIPGVAGTQQTTRIVDILRRSLAAEPTAKGAPRVLVAYPSPDMANRVSDAVLIAGYDVVRANSGREVMRRLNEAADIDLILMDEALPDPTMPTVLAQLRADRNAGLLPILLTASKEREEKLRRWVEQYRNVTVIPLGFALDPTDLKALLGQRLVDPSVPSLSEPEMKEYTEKSVRYLARLALGEPAGFDVRPAADAVANALRSARLTPEGQLAAVEVLGRVPGARAQSELANVVLDGRNPVFTRISATLTLVKHIQKHSPTLSRDVIGSLEALQSKPDTDPNLRASLSLLSGAMRPDRRTAGERLLQFQPALPPAQPLPAIPKDQ